MPTKRLFSDWNKEELEETFGLTRHRTLPAFDEWIERSATQLIDEVETVLLSRLQELLIDHADAWNETELIEYFIGPMLTFVNFNTPEFSIFSERPLSAVVGDYELAGEPDAVIAKGLYSPKIPYFCFHEYKKENEPKGDPAAQALSAMLAAQALNPRPHPIYGLYVVGKMWYFMVLDAQTYCISAGHNALKDELFDIFKILKTLKALLIEIATQETS
ncbi:hypothetical protein U14_01145 [Candidatus Moduliflexus flocculans]|uniref:Uncharacterized protein n=1 Tax=Candidatus Moduliflexus flocculans TaxID=1499966 RepID=A0A0S6VWV4_9BACT|nr:hypothetical protein U14_01145 [Candidatus Moduliflexus flocculans]